MIHRRAHNPLNAQRRSSVTILTAFWLGLVVGGLISEAATPSALPTLRLGDTEADHHRLHEAIHAAHILAEIGAGYEATRVLGAIATQASNNEAGEHAKHVLREWGLSLAELEHMSAEKLTARIAQLREARRDIEINSLHARNLIAMSRFREAAQVVRESWPSEENDHQMEGFNELLESLRLPTEFIESKRLPSETALSDQLQTSAETRGRREQIRFLRIFDPHASELAEAVNHHLTPRVQRNSEIEERRHPLERFHEEDEFEPPPLNELLPALIDRAERLITIDRTSALFVLTLVTDAAPDSEYAIQSKRLSDHIPPRPPNTLRRSLASRKDPGSTVFGKPQVRHYRIELSDQAIEQLREEPKHYVRGTFHEGTQSFPDVGIRIKGGWGSFRSLDGESKTAFTIKFNHFEKGRRFHGLRRIVLNNAVQDPSYLRESIGYSLFRDAGVPAPRINFATVGVNGKDYGLYVQVEAVTRDFLERWYDKTKGNLYEGPGDVLEWRELDLDSNQGREDRSDLRHLARAIEEASDDDPWRSLSQFVDRNEFTRFIALEQLVAHWDGYTQVNNYRMYQNPSTSKFEFFPHGGDQLFEESGMSIMRNQAGILARALMETKPGKESYLQVMRDILDQAWDENELKNRIAEIYLTIRPYLAAKGNENDRLQEFEHTIGRVLRFIKIRPYVVLSQLQSQGPKSSWRKRQDHGHSFLRHEQDEWE
jgi:spore coat protein H